MARHATLHLHAQHVIVPAGFVTDFASVPRIFWRVIGPPTGFGEMQELDTALHGGDQLELTRN
jgi:hypothetical protein